MKKIIINLAILLSISVSVKAESTLEFEDQGTDFSFFNELPEGTVAFSYQYMPYEEWKTKASGKDMPMDVAPVLRGMVDGDVKLPDPQTVDSSLYEGQQAEFAEVVNMKNQGGRAKITIPEGESPEGMLAASEASTHVVELKFSVVINRPFSSLQLNQENVQKLAENIDLDHYHFPINKQFVEQALEENHVGYKKLDEEHPYVLSVFDFRDYGCAVMKDGIRDYFSKNPAKDQLQNESIYLISRVDLNPSEALVLEKIGNYFGKKPDAVIVQESIYADHLIRGAKTVFGIFAEGEKTRIVLISNIAMGSKFFTGAKGAFIRQFLLDGVGVGGTGTLLQMKDGLSELISGATEDLSSKNSCDRGLALGLVKYSGNLFQGFVNFVAP